MQYNGHADANNDENNNNEQIKKKEWKILYIKIHSRVYLVKVISTKILLFSCIAATGSINRCGPPTLIFLCNDIILFMKILIIFILAISYTNMNGLWVNFLLQFKLALVLTENTDLDEDRLGQTLYSFYRKELP